jgi:hypothetical protein
MSNLSLLTDPGSFVTQEFGVPSCVMDLVSNILALGIIPTDVLMQITLAIQEGMALANAMIAEFMQELFGKLGIIEFDTFTGKVQLFPDSNMYTLGLALAGLGAIAGFVAGIDQFITQVGDQIESIKNCLEQLKSDREKKMGIDPATGQPKDLEMPATARKALLEASIENANDFLSRASAGLQNIATVLEQRESEPEAKPEEEEGAIFRLVYGPPKAKRGQFILSRDGLYYDSQNRDYAAGDVPGVEDIGFVADQTAWKLDHAASLGGKGTRITLADLDEYVDTILDINNIDESEALVTHYEADAPLQIIEGQKLKVLTDMETQKQALITSGYDADSAVVVNYQQQIFSELQAYEVKAKKRKKQIELAVKAPDLYGSSSLFAPGEVPINDFSYLEEFNVAVDVKKQRVLAFDHGEVSGVILPVKPIFVREEDSMRRTAVVPIEMNRIGTGALTNAPDASSTTLPTLSLTDAVTTDGLISVYSFLDAKVSDPSSTDFTVANSFGQTANNAQLVAKSASTVFTGGLTIPKLTGIARYQGGATPVLSGLGSFIKLPDTMDMQNLMYNMSGMSMDTWLHLPGFGTGVSGYERTGNLADTITEPPLSACGRWTDFHYYKVLLANENTGGDLEEDANDMVKNESSNLVKGMVVAITRDPQWTRSGLFDRGTDANIGSAQGLDSSALVGDNALIIAPTQSLNTSDVEFIRNGSCNETDKPLLGMAVDCSATTDSGYSINDCSSDFIHLGISMSPDKNFVRVYLNGELLAEELYTATFQTQKGRAAQIPSFIIKDEGKNPSFGYTSATVSTTNTTDFALGPKNHLFFTPWVVGGGWTDGMGFMGESRGTYSGLNGHIGSLKFYGKGLTEEQIKHNYDAHKDFFGNVEV